jgi:hypothetical protein
LTQSRRCRCSGQHDTGAQLFFQRWGTGGFDAQDVANFNIQVCLCSGLTAPSISIV